MLRRIGHRAAAEDRRHRNHRHFRLLAQQQHGAVVQLEAVERRQRDARSECAVCEGREQEHGEKNAGPGQDHSASSCTAATGACSIPIVALLRRKTLAPTALSSSPVIASMSFARSNNFS